MSKVYKLKLINLSRKYAGTAKERREWIATFMRNEAKRESAISWLGDKWILARKVERKACQS